MGTARALADALGLGVALWRCSDHEVIDMLLALAPDAGAGGAAPTAYRLSGAPAAGAAPAPAAGGGSGTARAAPPAQAAAPAAGALSANLDAAAMAQALRDAARDGVPFCEECERARQRRVAEAA